MNKTGSIIIIFVLSLFSCTGAQAAWYQVEVIVFKQLQPDTDGEVWYANPGLPDRTNSIELITDVPEDEGPAGANGSKTLVPFQELGKESYRLDGIYQALKLSRYYRPLYHTSWQQPALSAPSSRAVHLEAFYETDETEGDQPPEQAAIQIPGETYQPQETLFDGTILVRSTRFLHVDVDIAYFPESMPGANQETGVDTENQEGIYHPHADYVRMRESRKIKLNELHYFDHPLFGVILQVSRIETKEGEGD